MTSQNPEPQLPQIRTIRRKQVQQYLAISAFVATQLLTACSDSTDAETSNEPTVPALFYETTEQCEAHARKQQDQYAVQRQEYEQKKRPMPPPAPVIKATDCPTQMAAAKREHDRHAPVYQRLSDCQADDVRCEATPVGHATPGYRPIFGGTYFYPYSNTNGASSGLATSSYHSTAYIHSPRTVYRGFDPGSVVTPQGTVLTKSNPGVAIVPQHTSLTAPSRPSGYTARGTITGRSNRTGFGSTFKSTGRGGK